MEGLECLMRQNIGQQRRMLVRAEGMECLLIESTEGKASKEIRGASKIKLKKVNKK